MSKPLDLTGLIKLKFPDGNRKGHLWKYSDSKERMIYLAAPKGPSDEKWSKPKLFKAVRLYNGTTNGAPLLDSLKIPAGGQSKWFSEDGSGRQIRVSKFRNPKQLPKTPCTIVIENKWYLIIKKPQERND